MQQVRKGTSPQRSRACDAMGPMGESRSAPEWTVDAPPWCWSWNTPAGRPCPLVLCGADSKPAVQVSRPQKHLPYTAPSPPPSPSARVLVTTASRVPSHTRTVRKHKGEHGAATEEARRSPLGSRGKPPASPREAARRSRARGTDGGAGPQHLGQRRPLGGGASATGTAGAVRHARGAADPMPQRVCQPQLLQDSSLQSGKARVPLASTLTPGTWVAGT